MTGGLLIRAAMAPEAASLSELCFLSKQAWGYDDAFMAASRDALTISEAAIEAGLVWVCAGEGGALLGVAEIGPPEGGIAELDKLFVAPSAFRKGVGAALLGAAAREAARRGAHGLRILADPNAAGFYARMQAAPAGDAPSDAIAGRRLPVFLMTLD